MYLKSYERLKSLFSNEKVSLDLDQPFMRNRMRKSDMVEPGRVDRLAFEANLKGQIRS